MVYARTSEESHCTPFIHQVHAFNVSLSYSALHSLILNSGVTQMRDPTSFDERGTPTSGRPRTNTRLPTRACLRQLRLQDWHQVLRNSLWVRRCACAWLPPRPRRTSLCLSVCKCAIWLASVLLITCFILLQ